MKTTIEYKELELDIEYSWANASGDNWNEPYEPAHIEEITEILLNGVDIIEIVHDKYMDEIIDIVFEQHVNFEL